MPNPVPEDFPRQTDKSAATAREIRTLADKLALLLGEQILRDESLYSLTIGVDALRAEAGGDLTIRLPTRYRKHAEVGYTSEGQNRLDS